MTSATDWNGPVGDVWAREWRRTDRCFGELSRHLDAAILTAAPPDPFRALDIGCGAGATTLALVTARPDAEIVGIDLSLGLVEVARERAVATPVLPRRRESRVTGDTAGYSGPPPARGHGALDSVVFLAGDAPKLAAAHAPFDLLYSRHGVMFFDDPAAAFAALHATANSDARLVFSCFRAMAENPWAVALIQAAGGTAAPPAADPPPGPFAFADPARVAAILTAAGWRDATPTPVDFAYRAGEGTDPVADALDFFKRIGPAAPLIRAADPADRAAILARIEAILTERRTGDTIDFPAAAWIWSAKA